MTALNSRILIDAPPQPRGGRVNDFIDRLNQPAFADSHASGPISALIQSVIGAGLIPLFLWPMRWANLVESERQDLLDLIAWWRRRVAPSDAAKLDKIAGRFRPRPILMVLPWLAALFNIACGVTLMARGDTFGRLGLLMEPNALRVGSFSELSPDYYDPSNPNRWISRAVSHEGTVYTSSRGFKYADPALPVDAYFYSAWMTSLLVGCLIHCYAVRSHMSAVHSLVRWTNQRGRENGFVQIPNDALRIGAGPLWILLGFALYKVWFGWYAVPLVLAGAMQRQYTTKSSPQIRAALARQARDAFAIVQNNSDHFCAAGHCGARLPVPARYCPRCGTAVQRI